MSKLTPSATPVKQTYVEGYPTNLIAYKRWKKKLVFFTLTERNYNSVIIQRMTFMQWFSRVSRDCKNVFKNLIIWMEVQRVKTRATESSI